MNVIMVNSYSVLREKLGAESFAIFGYKNVARVFYFYCFQHDMLDKIAAFVVSKPEEFPKTISGATGIPVRSVEWFEQQKETRNIYLGAGQGVVENELLAIFSKMADKNIFYLPRECYSRYNSQLQGILEAYQERNYVLEPLRTFSGAYGIHEIGSSRYYLHVNRFANYVVPDKKIFGEDASIDALHFAQLGSAGNIRTSSEDCVSDKSYAMYVVKSHFDKPLAEDESYADKEYEQVIQVGAALTLQNIAGLKDNTGDNISIRNQDYCEMTAAYWIWQNDTVHDYVGLNHYRRRFDMDEALIRQIIADGYDAVYALPQLTDGGMYAEFVARNEYISKTNWELTRKAIEELYPDDVKLWDEFAEALYLLPCNLSFMKREIWCDYCEWVFAILFKVDGYYSSRNIQPNNRYLGYIAECLTTVYAMKHKNDMKFGYVEFKFLKVKSNG